jgi:hypothetical protein
MKHCPKEKEFFEREYVLLEKSTREIAEEFGYSPSTVWRRVKSFGICRSASDSMKAEKNSMWKGGEKSDYLHRIVKEHFKEYRCNRCGNTNDIHIHHRDRNQRNNRIKNVELLCRSCHSKEHKGEGTGWIPPTKR